MSADIEPLPDDPDQGPQAAGEEALLRCRECEYAAPAAEFAPERYR